MCIRCSWAKTPLEIEYHDTFWGVPKYDDDILFEMLILEGMQAGLTWRTILERRDAMAEAFDGFDCHKLAKCTDTKFEKLLLNEKIIRNRLKIKSLKTNALAFIKTQDELGSFSSFLWSFVDNTPIQNSFATLAEIPAETDISITMSKAMKKRGFTFVGPTICYAYMQAVGLVNDHIVSCFRYDEVKKKSVKNNK